MDKVMLDQWSFDELFACIYQGGWPYKVRRDKSQDLQWQVFHHSIPDAVSPVVDSSFSDMDRAEDKAYHMNKNLMEAVIERDFIKFNDSMDE